MSWKRKHPERRLRPLIECIPQSETHEMWVDMGTGDGFFTKLLKSHLINIDVVKIDVSSNSDFSVLGIRSYIQHPPFRKNSIDGILCSQVLHYVPRDHQLDVVNSLTKVISKKGKLVIIEYMVDQSYSWIPYPIAQNEVFKFESVNLKILRKTQISDGRRPKYSVIYQKI